MKKIFLSLIFLSNIVFAQNLEPPVELQGKPVKIIIPYAPGGDTDAIQRFMAEQVSKLTGINFIYLNQPGANTIVGANAAAKADQDGLTLFGSDNALFVTNPALQIPNHVDPAKFTALAVFAATPQFFYVSSKHGINNLNDLINAAKTNPKFNYACTSTLNCLIKTYFFQELGTTYPNAVRFTAVNQAIIALHQNDVSVISAGSTTGLPHVKSGNMKAIAIAWNKPLDVYPSATPISSVVPNFIFSNLQMVSMPAGASAQIKDFWNRAYREATKTVESQKKYAENSTIAFDMNLLQTDDFLKREYNNIHKIRKHSIF